MNAETIEQYLAIVDGTVIEKAPDDLFIPPDALKVVLEIFEGPLDLLLYLIRKQNLDILNISVAKITHQYIDYIEMMQSLKLELAAEYLEMAALLAEIKSRMMLPKPKNEEEEEIDPRKELIRRLQEYEVIKTAAENLDQIPRCERDIHPVHLNVNYVAEPEPPEVDLKEVLFAFKDVLKRVDLTTAHTIEKETLTVREKMSMVLDGLKGDKFIEFIEFFDPEEGRLGVVVTFIAILELAKEQVIELVQAEPFARIYVRAAIC